MEPRVSGTRKAVCLSFAGRVKNSVLAGAFPCAIRFELDVDEPLCSVLWPCGWIYNEYTASFDADIMTLVEAGG